MNKKILILTLLILIIVLVSGCEGKISKQGRIKACQECGFEKVTDSKNCCYGLDCVTQIECDNDNYIHAYENTPSNIIEDKWGRYKKTEYLESEIITKCKKFNC